MIIEIQRCKVYLKWSMPNFDWLWTCSVFLFVYFQQPLKCTQKPVGYSSDLHFRQSYLYLGEIRKQWDCTFAGKSIPPQFAYISYIKCRDNFTLSLSVPLHTVILTLRLKVMWDMKQTYFWVIYFLQFCLWHTQRMRSPEVNLTILTLPFGWNPWLLPEPNPSAVWVYLRT